MFRVCILCSPSSISSDTLHTKRLAVGNGEVLRIKENGRDEGRNEMEEGGWNFWLHSHFAQNFRGWNP